MQDYCGVNLSTGKLYVGSTTQLRRRLRHHEETKRLGEGQVYWLVGEDHEDDNREHEQFYLDFFFRSPWSLNRSGDSQLGNGHGRDVSETTRERLSKALEGNDNGKYNRGQKRSQKRRQFGRFSKTPEQTRQRLREAKHKARGEKQSAAAKKAARVGHLSRWGGYQNVYPATREFRTALSSDFVDYFATYGWW